MSVVVRVCQCGPLCSDTLLLQPTVSYDYFRPLWEKLHNHVKHIVCQNMRKQILAIDELYLFLFLVLILGLWFFFKLNFPLCKVEMFSCQPWSVLSVFFLMDYQGASWE